MTHSELMAILKAPRSPDVSEEEHLAACRAAHEEFTKGLGVAMAIETAAAFFRIENAGAEAVRAWGQSAKANLREACATMAAKGTKPESIALICFAFAAELPRAIERGPAPSNDDNRLH